MFMCSFLQYDTVMTATTLVRVETSGGGEKGKEADECEEVTFEVYRSKGRGSNRVSTGTLCSCVLFCSVLLMYSREERVSNYTTVAITFVMIFIHKHEVSQFT